MSNDTSKFSRRMMVKIAGMGLVGVWGQKYFPALEAAQQPAATPGAKAIFLPPDNSADAAIHSRAENLFWSDIMMEHAAFFAMYMPGAELAAQRTQAENFQRS